MSLRHTYLYHYNKQNKKPIGCLAVQLDRDKNEIIYAFSTCSPQDKFNAKLAQKIAFGRLALKPQIIKTEVPVSGHQITARIMQHILDHNSDQRHNLTPEENRDWRNHRHFLAFQAAQMWIENVPKTNS